MLREHLADLPDMSDPSPLQLVPKVSRLGILSGRRRRSHRSRLSPCLSVCLSVCPAGTSRNLNCTARDERANERVTTDRKSPVATASVVENKGVEWKEEEDGDGDGESRFSGQKN